MQINPNKVAKFSIDFVNAFDEFNEINRKLFEIPDVDKFLSFSNKKNICIVNKSRQSITSLHSIITRFCINYHICDNNNNAMKNNKTILVDAGNGNNLGYIYLNLVNQSLKDEFDVDKVLDNIITVRAFTFYQLVNIIINETPRLLYQPDCKIQIIILDLLDTLLSNSKKIKTNVESSYWNNKNNFDDHKILLNEMVDYLINISSRFFVVLTYDNSNKLIDDSLIFKFNNVVEINQMIDKNNNKKKGNNETEFIIKTKSDNAIYNKILLSTDKITDSDKKI